MEIYEKKNKISGPVSYTLLKPNDNNKIYTSYILLLGDEHFSNEYICDNCNDDEQCLNTLSNNNENDFLNIFN